jgi:hypothetical protein
LKRAAQHFANQENTPVGPFGAASAFLSAIAEDKVMPLRSFLRRRTAEELAEFERGELRPQPAGDLRGQYGFGRRAHEADPNADYGFSQERPRPKFGRAGPAPVEQYPGSAAPPRRHRLASFGRE